MTSPTELPPASEEKNQGSFSGAASARALAEVSEALNGLRELASRVAPHSAKVTPVQDEAMPPAAEDQLDLELALQPEPIPVQTIAEPPPPPSAPARRPRVGETLREARESAGFTLEEVAQEVKIKLAYLRAIEEGRYGELPARTYAVGFVRTYAQALGLHAEELVARCRSEVGTIPKITPQLVMPEPETDRRLPGGTLMTICAVLAVLAYAASYSFLRPTVTSAPYPAPPPVEAEVQTPAQPQVQTPSQQAQTQAPAPVAATAPESKPEETSSATQTPPVEEKKSAAAEEATPSESAAPESPPAKPEKTAEAVTAKAAPASSPAPEDESEEAAPSPKANAAEVQDGAAAPVPGKPPSRIKLRAVGNTSVRITDNQGHVLAERVIHKGEAFYVPDHRHYMLATSDAGALRLQIDGRDMPPLGETGEAMHNIPLDATDLLQVMAE